MDEAVEFIEENQVQTWREIEIDGKIVKDGLYSFYFDSDDRMYRVRYDMGKDTSIINTCVNWFGDYDKHKSKPSISFESYTWYGMMDGRKTKAVLLYLDDDIYLDFETEE